MDLFDFQLNCKDFHLKHYYSINGMEMGLGKSVTALSVISEVDCRFAVVVVPAFLKSSWEFEIDKFYPELKSKIRIVKYGQLKDPTLFKDADFIIADEAHYLKNLEAKRTRYFHYIIKTIRPKRLLLLSGTPIKNRVSEFYSLLVLMSYTPTKNNGLDITQKYKNQWSFNNRFSNAVKINIGNRKITKFEGHKNVSELKEYMKDKYIRYTSDIVSLPELTHIPKFIPKAKYEKELSEAWEAYTGTPSEHISQAKVASACAKVKTTCELAAEVADEGHQVIIFTDHLKSLYEMYEILGGASSKSSFACELIHGQVSMDRRSLSVDRFREGKSQILIATIGAASVGLNLQFCHYMIFNDYPWVPADLKQAEKRIHRVGQTHPCFIYNVFSGKVDAMIYKTLESKTKTLKEVL